MRLIVQMDYKQGAANKNLFIITVMSVYKEKHRALEEYIM